uniref:Uncharacterized protein n=1 Tax=Neolamprologus brichardi TaxID=32507 RepID=A0A3Q4GUC9_NEOBR
TSVQSYPAMMPCNSSECNLMIVWVERFEDIEFPCVWSPVTYQVTNRDQVKLSSFSRFKTMKNLKMCKHTFVHQSLSVSTIQLIFIHPLKTGLYRIHVSENTTSKFGLVVPLVSGSVVSKRSLGFLVREMVINWCHRRLLESDSTPPPHIRRKHMINDITLRYRIQFGDSAYKRIRNCTS